MELHKNLVRDERTIEVFVRNLSRAIPKGRTEETAISATSERETKIDRSGSRWCDDSSKHNVGRPVYLLFDKHQSSGDSRGTNRRSIPISINSLMEIGSSETPSKDFVWSVIDRIHKHQKQLIESTTDIRLRETVHASTGHEWESVDEIGTLQLCGNQRVDSPITVEERPSNYDANNSYGFTTNDVATRQLSDDNDIQYEEDLLGLLNLLKNKYPFRDEMNKDVLYDDEIERFTVLYSITNVCPVLSCYNSIFWLKDPDGVIYMWSRTDDMMIRGGDNMKEALRNFLFHQENLCYINEYTHELISVKVAKDKAKKWYEENKETAIETVVFDKSLKLVGKQQRRKNKH
ncbi:hypothetical protein C1645_768870 [Glomus cerebriforme]|uniref:Uncharacterized protein n=1 Tax=Glomus cerebriforme TaxID=658196 RepID=A0A397T6V5_9GLOM|nr:hypothetical protein C1645_768870 [Glomus cerebriforme]